MERVTQMAGAAPGPAWLGANRRYLMAVLDDLRAVLADHAAKQRGAAAAGGARPDLEGLARAMTPPPALVQLCAVFDLSPFERDVLMLCAGVELDGAFASYCAAAQGDRQRTAPTFGLALAALPGAHWSALTPQAPLRRWRLVETVAGMPLTSAPLRIDERVLHHLTGIPEMDERLGVRVSPVPAAARVAASHAALGRRLAQALERRPGQGGAVHLWGADRSARRAVAAEACRAAGLRLARVHAQDLPAEMTDRETFVRLWDREARLTGAALLVECDDADPAGAARGLVGLVDRLGGPLVVSTRDPLAPDGLDLPRVEVGQPTAEEQRELWREAIGREAEALGDRIDRIVGQFSLGAAEIDACAAQAVTASTGSGPEALGRALWQACRARARARLDDVADRIEPTATWEQLVLPEAGRRTLQDIVAHARQRGRVLAAWSLGRPGGPGPGIGVLFAGPAGTGKSMAAELLARELDLDLYRIDLAGLGARCAGESALHLRRLLDAAAPGGSVLLVDGADALLARRGEVADGHGQCASPGAGDLLHRVERHRGVVVFITAGVEQLDPALLRRLSFVVEFPVPDAAHRAEIWRRIFPPAIATEGLDVERLARLGVPGADIRDLALHGAALAADAGEPLRMSHLRRAAASGYARLDLVLPDAEARGRD